MRLAKRKYLLTIAGRPPNHGFRVLSFGAAAMTFLKTPSAPQSEGVTPSSPASILALHLEAVENFGAATHGVQAICRAGV